MTRRSDWVDVAKGLGIVLVVHGHVARGLMSAGLVPDAPWLKLIDRGIYMFHMPLFFFLAGLFFWPSRRQRSDAAFMVGKAETIVYPYLLWSLLQGGLEVMLSRFTNGAVTTDQVLALLWLPRAQFWFLYSLFLIIVVACLLLRRDLWWRDWVVFGLGVWMFLDGWRLPQEYRPWLVTSWFVYFAAGICASRWDWPRIASRRNWVFLAGVVGVVFWLGVQVQYPEPTRLGGWPGLIAAAAGIAFAVSLSLLLCWRPGRLSAGLLSLGRASMAIYLMHILVGAAVRTALAKGLHVHDLGIHLVAGLALGLGVPWWIHRHAANPFLAWMFAPPTWLSRRKVSA